MKRFWLLALLAGSLAVVAAPVSAKMMANDDSGSDQSDTMAQFQDDVNSGLGSLSSRMSAVEKALKVEVHGFAELDAIFDDTQMGLGTETIGDNAQVPQSGTVGQRNGQSQFSPRNSRLSVLGQDTVDGWLTKGYVEADFLGITNSLNGAAVSVGKSEATAVGGNENKEYTQPTFRIRHAYLDAQKDGWDIMAGQYWTLFGWNMDNVLATLDVSPIMGSLYERTPRIGVMKTFGGDAQVQIAVDAERPEQAFSMIPNFNGGVRFFLNGMKAQFAYATGASKLVPFSLGISGTLRNYAYLPVGVTNATYKDTTGQGVAVDAQIPILTATSQVDNSTLILTGEWMIGQGVADALNGWNGGGVGAPPSPTIDAGIAAFRGATFTLVDDQSWNAQLQFHLPQTVGTYLTVGYGETYTDNAVLLGGTYNDVNGMFVNVVQDFTDHVRAGVEYSRFDDHYLAGAAGIDHRVQFSTWYRF